MIDTQNVFTTQDLRYKLLHEVAVVFLKRKIRLSYTCMSMKDHNMVYQLYYKTIQNIKKCTTCTKHYLRTMYSQGPVKLSYHANFTRVAVPCPRTN